MRNVSMGLAFFLLLTACADDGNDGATGPAGINGTNGTNGTPGATGPTGPAGATGAAGAPGSAGDAGAAGPSGFVAVQDVDGLFSSQLTTTLAQPPVTCQSASYTASAGETALVDLTVNVDPAGATSTDFLLLEVGMSANGAAFTPTTLQTAFAEMGGAVSISTRKRIPLVAGTAYKFGPMMSSQLGNVNVSLGTCLMLVTIVRAP